jgi:hypothetical protein
MMLLLINPSISTLPLVGLSARRTLHRQVKGKRLKNDHVARDSSWHRLPENGAQNQNIGHYSPRYPNGKE